MMLMRLAPFATVLLLGARGVAADPAANFHPDYSKRLDISLLASGAATLVIGGFTSPTLQSVPAEGLDPAEIGLAMDRNSLGEVDIDAISASNVLRDAAIVFPLVLSAISAPGARWQAPCNRALLFGESLALANGVTAIMKNATSRPRPFTYLPEADRPDDPAYEVDGNRAFRSMPSGHASNAWCAASFSMTDHLLTRPNASWKEHAAVGLAASLLASSASLMRVEASQHFPTDVLAGAGIGIASGAAVPLLHGYFSSTGRAPMPPRRSWLASAAGAAVAAGLVIGVDALGDSP